jgi:hypothetical protein
VTTALVVRGTDKNKQDTLFDKKTSGVRVGWDGTKGTAVVASNKGGFE